MIGNYRSAHGAMAQRKHLADIRLYKFLWTSLVTSFFYMLYFWMVMSMP